MSPQIFIDRKQIEAFCKKWKIKEFSLFGSVLRNDFRPESDVDVMVSFFPDTDWSLLDEVSMQQELEGILGRTVDLVERSVIEQSRNPIRKKSILSSAELYYVEG